MNYLKFFNLRPRRFELLQISHQEIILPLNHGLKKIFNVFKYLNVIYND